MKQKYTVACEHDGKCEPVEKYKILLNNLLIQLELYKNKARNFEYKLKQDRIKNIDNIKDLDKRNKDIEFLQSLVVSMREEIECLLFISVFLDEAKSAIQSIALDTTEADIPLRFFKNNLVQIINSTVMSLKQAIEFFITKLNLKGNIIEFKSLDMIDKYFRQDVNPLFWDFLQKVRIKFEEKYKLQNTCIEFNN